MNLTEIKAQIGATHGFTMSSLTLVQQFQDRKLEPTETNVLVKNDKGDIVPTSFDPIKPDQLYPVKVDWVSAWFNDQRVRVSMHESIMNALKADLTKSDLAIKKELIAAHGETAPYTRYIVITPKNVVATF
jgi:hypothetical protein